MSYQSLYIGHAPVSVTTEKLKKEFDTYLNADIVSRIDEKVKYELKTGKPYKIFFIHFGWINPSLEKIFQDISNYQSTKVNKWTVKFNTRLRDTPITHSPIAIQGDEYWIELANSFKP